MLIWSIVITIVYPVKPQIKEMHLYVVFIIKRKPIYWCSIVILINHISTFAYFFGSLSTPKCSRTHLWLALCVKKVAPISSIDAPSWIRTYCPSSSNESDDRRKYPVFEIPFINFFVVGDKPINLFKRMISWLSQSFSD